MNFLKLSRAILVFALGAPAAAYGQDADSGAFVVRLGRDTLAIERFVRTRQQLRSEAVLRTPQTRELKLTLTFKDDGNVSWYEILNNPVPSVPNSAPVIRSLVTYIGDSARVELWTGGVQRSTRTLPASGSMLPLQMPFYSTYETALLRARDLESDPMPVTMLAASGPLRYELRLLGRDSATLSTPESGTNIVRFDKTGRITTFDGQATTFKVVANRTKWLDLAPYLKRYAKADSAGRSIGALSPRDSLEAPIGEGDVLIDYGRPSKRARVVFGGIVPWNAIWRTGANAATQIEFTVPVTIQGVEVPKGKYTLWTIPNKKQWQLILNKQTGQWGTVYNDKHDLARIPIASETVARPVETFTIELKPSADFKTTTMTLTWDRTRLTVPIKAK